MTTNGITNPFDYDIKKLEITNSAGAKVNMKLIMIELNIFEDLFGGIMSGSLVVTDSTDICSAFSLIGNEFIEIVVDKPGLNNPISKTFRIYNISPIPVTQGNRSVIFYFCSEELLVSKAVKISRSYNTILISDIVKDVVSNYLRINPAYFPDAHIEPTLGITNILIPSYNPIQTINWLSSRAISSKPGSTYFFYENRDGFWFQSIQNILANSTEPVRTFKYNVKNVERDSTPENFDDVTAYEFMGTQNSLQGLQQGAFGAKFLGVDVLRQKVTTTTMNGDDLYRESKHSGSGQTVNGLVDRNGNTLATSYNSRIVMYPTNAGQSQNQYIANNNPTPPTNVETWILKRKAQIAQICQMRLKLLVPGDPRLKVGDLIRFNIPSNQAMTGKNIGELSSKLDQYNTGNYLITAIRHKFNIIKYEMVLEVTRDSLDRAPEPANNNDNNIKRFN